MNVIRSQRSTKQSVDVSKPRLGILIDLGKEARASNERRVRAVELDGPTKNASPAGIEPASSP